MNPSYRDQIRGTVGELLLQIRLFEHNIESSVPVIDSGNDIIALKGDIVKSIQVKTKRYETSVWGLRKLPKMYHILALIEFADVEYDLDHAKIYLLTKKEVNGRQSISSNSVDDKCRLSKDKINELFV